MFSFFRQTFTQWARSGTRAGARPRAVRRLECESLEDRLLLSLSGAQLFANSLPTAEHAVLASVSGGRSVVAWTVENNPLDHDIKAQLFDAAGNQLGSVLTVAGGRENQYAPTVAINASGAFVVAWTMDFSQIDKDIHATLFRADGSRVADDFDVAVSYKAEYAPTVGIDARGNFVVSYTFQFSGADTDVKAAQFNASATLLRTLDVATSSKVEANTGIAVAPDGSFAVSYTSAGVLLVRHFNAGGQPLDGGVVGLGTPPPPPPAPPPPPPVSTGLFLVNSSTAHVQNQAAVASSALGRTVVVWADAQTSTNHDIQAQLFDASGHKIGSTFLVAGGSPNQYAPVVAMDGQGNFVVAWVVDSSATDKDVWAERFRADGTALGAAFQVAATSRAEYDPSIAVDASGNFFISYTRQNSSIDTDVYTVLFRADGTFVRTLAVASSTRAEGQSSIAATPDGHFAVAYTDSNTVMLRRYDRFGNLLGSTAVSQATVQAAAPSVALDASGNAVVAYQVAAGSDWNVEARRIGNTGFLGAILPVQATAALETSPAVALDSATGKVLVVYQSDTASVKSVKATELSATGTALRTFTVGTNLTAPAVGVGANHGFLIAANSLIGNVLDPDGGIFGSLGQF